MAADEKMEVIKIEKDRSAFAGWPTLIFILGMLIFAFHACTHMVAAGDTWVAMACGRHHSNHGVDTVEPFSANSHDSGPTKESISQWPSWARSIASNFDLETIKKWHPTGWINQNWLTHVTFYQFAKNFGSDGNFNYDGLVYWKFLIFTIQAFCIYFFARLIGVSIPMSALASAMAMLIGRSFLDIRPACYANVLASILLLVMALSIYKNYLYIWLIVPITVFWANVHGGYVYVFMMMFPFIILNFISIPFRDRFYSVGLKGVFHAIGAGFAAFFAMTLFNPFHLTNLTHTFEVSISEHAKSWRSVNEWHPAFKMDNPVGSSWPFLYMFIAMWIIFFLWAGARFLKPSMQNQAKKRRSRQKKSPKPEINWPKIDLSVIVIAAISVYMAVKSRRFIPIAALAACPVMALMLEQTVRMILSRRNYELKGKLQMPPIHPVFTRWVIIGAALAAIGFGGFWGAKFKRIYLDPWPMDDVRDSVFMRMTASNVKPFDVCRFMRDNKLSGNMFNYWTEGGAIAFGQEPDPETGRTPLQLFMDGRAQAAYDHSNFMRWRYLYAGGPVANKVRGQNRIAKTGSDEMKEIGEFLNNEMKKRDIWVFVLPTSQFRPSNEPIKVNYFPLALSSHPEWVPVYIDEHQRMYVNQKMEKGRTLLAKVLSQKAKFPNEYSKNLTLSYLYMRMGAARALQGFEFGKKAFEINPTQAAMIQVSITADHYNHLLSRSVRFVEDYVNEFKENKKTWSRQGGYAKKLEAAYIGTNYLAGIYQEKNPKKRKEYAELTSIYVDEREQIARDYKW